MSRIALHLVMSAAALLAGCGERSPAASYFPLDAGHRWTYQLTSTWADDSRERETLVLSALGEEDLADGKKAWRRRSETGIDYWLRSDASGVYRVATKTDVQEAPKPDAAPRFVLKLPLAAGTRWQAGTTAYLLRRRAEFPPEIRHSHPDIAMNYVIEALGQTVETPAGQFSDCLRVKGSATVHLFVDPVQGWQDLPLTTREWYCAGVGLVRLERDEPANSTFLLGGQLKMELMSWQ